MDKKFAFVHVFVAASLLSIPLIAAPIIGKIDYASAASGVRISDLRDVPEGHWAYDAVKRVVETLGFMPPREMNAFRGDEVATRYDLAVTMHNAAKKLDELSGKDMRMYPTPRKLTFTDVDDIHQAVVSSIVNEYGIMEGMPGGKFMGSGPITRYEVAAQMNSYLQLLENKLVKPAPTHNRGRSNQMADLSSSHWATPAVRNMVDLYQLMDGYPDGTFQGGKKMTRYEASAVFNKFFDYVDLNLLSLTPTPTPMPTAIPTPVPTPKPTPVPTPTPTPTPIPKKPLSNWDIKAGATLRWTGSQKGNEAPITAMVGGPTVGANFWLPKMGPVRLGIGATSEFLFYEFNRFDVDSLFTVNSGATLNWRIMGTDSDEDPSLTLGLGYSLLQRTGVNADKTNLFYTNHGPRAELNVEIPILPWLSFVVNDAFTYYLGQAPGYIDHMEWRNDAFVGLNLPAYSLFSVQIGYRDTRYRVPARIGAEIQGESGAAASVRVRF